MVVVIHYFTVAKGHCGATAILCKPELLENQQIPELTLYVSVEKNIIQCMITKAKYLQS